MTFLLPLSGLLLMLLSLLSHLFEMGALLCCQTVMEILELGEESVLLLLEILISLGKFTGMNVT